ncbi:L-threonylcarbamoyladenylate synthase [Jatrophihabitans endophyticus]|uniref:L-threonylcarbamoyladenylate synthase n=1 Tax=Jatrophihabitans endophyticus TaxID=1206085 RepID=UPI0019E30761|nr:L-threonylcarbamoyladenylate synthase [Jatrophihabitans endophyticus]MBE7188870.1 threonylcarbamoyl-AMP synthase [Jatrophihabitans endophyticus]
MALFFHCGDPDVREDAIATAARSVTSGELVVLPTDTVYGLGADAFDGVAVAELLRTKGRGRDMPVPVLVGSWSTIDGLVSAVDDRTRALVEAFWPGGLTLVVRHAPSLTWDLGDAAGTVAIRMPLHPVAIELLEQTGPMAVSSANLSGHPAAQTAAEARAQLGEDVAVYLEDGPASGGVASTIVDVTGARPRILRLGAVTEADLRDVVPDVLAPPPPPP